MKAILSHPFSGAVYWWSAQQIGHLSEDVRSKKPHHGYYKSLYADVDSNLDVALACTVVFEEVLLPGADAALSSSYEGSPETIPELELKTSGWDLVRQVADVVRGDVTADLLRDPVISAVLRRVPGWAKEFAIESAAVDVAMAAEFQAPIICAAGRRRIVSRMVELDVLGIPMSGVSNLIGAQETEMIEAYSDVVGLTFRSDDVASLAAIKWNEKIRQYAEGFQQALLEPGLSQPDGLYEKIADAWTSAAGARDVAGAFTATTKTLSVMGLVPGIGTLTGAVGLASDIGAAVAAKKAEKAEWYELGPEISRQRSLGALKKSLEERGLL